jgi:adenylate cyclase
MKFFRQKLALAQVFTLSLAALGVLLGILLYVVYTSSEKSILQSAEFARAEASREISDRVIAYIAEVQKVMDHFEIPSRYGSINLDDPSDVERHLYGLLLSRKGLIEISFTHANMTGESEGGWAILDPSTRWQIVVYRLLDEPGGLNRIVTRYTHLEKGRFVFDVRNRPSEGSFLSAPLVRAPDSNIPDPTAHLTFRTPARRKYRGETKHSDIHRSQIDSHLPEDRQRIEVSGQRALLDLNQKLRGVLRIGAHTTQLDRLTQITLDPEAKDNPYRVFICDNTGRLVTRLSPDDALREFENDFRIVPKSMPHEIQLALGQPELKKIDRSQPEHLIHSSRFETQGKQYLATFRAIDTDADWVVGIVVPQEYYLRDLNQIRNHLIFISSGVIFAVILGGFFLFRAVNKASSRIVGETSQMIRFNFEPTPSSSKFRDIEAVLEGIEQAKTAMRALGKYVPINLVRQLYEKKREPVLGGVSKEITLMFTDIENFTGFAEAYPPEQLAQSLGLYLETMAKIIQQETGGTIDKFIGDAIMAIWNAPTPVADHPHAACRAALQCQKTLETLFQSLPWHGLPPFRTRFGLHVEKVLVGNFGAPDRMDYTAIGDGVNLTSRLESLNKHYGTAILVSESIYTQTINRFEFRLIDVVSVKGKSKGLEIYELLGNRGDPIDQRMSSIASQYGQAFEAYRQHQFAQALSLLEKFPDDGPSQLLHRRCQIFLDTPPSPDWDGVYSWTMK